MYDMYPWDKTAPRRVEDTSAPAIAPATQAVQFALDRRDNGGETESTHPSAAPTCQ